MSIVSVDSLHWSGTRRLRVIAGALLVGAWGLVAATAAAQRMDSTQVARFQLADSFLRAAQFDRAIALLEDLYDADPENYAFYSKLKEAYENVKRYDDAAAIVNERLTADRNASLLSDLARIRYLSGDESGAFATWEEAVATSPGDANTYRVVYQALLDLRLFDRAIELLERARVETGGPDLFRPDLAYLNSLTGRHEAAMEEYLGLLSENEQQLGFVRSRLGQFVEQEEALRSSLAAVERAVRREPLNRAFRELLGWLYVEGGDYASAFDAYRAIDRLEGEDGQVLFQFAQMAADAAAYDVAAQAFEEVIDRYPDAPPAPQALAGFGEMHERWASQVAEQAFDETGHRIEAPHYDLALTTYRAFLQDFPHHELFPTVLRRIGRLQQDVFFDLGSAEAALEQVVAQYPGTTAADEAAYDLARAALMRGDAEDARLRFGRIVDRLRTGSIAENARYQLARIHFFAGEFEAASTLVTVIDSNTSTDVANDAIELRLLLMENRGPDSLDVPLHSFANALYAREQRRSAAAIDTVEALLRRFPQHALADDARFLRADILRAAGRIQEAYRGFAEIPLMHPQSHLADRALFAAAELQETRLGETDGAVRTYQKLLSDHPGSLLANKARQRIRHLRGDGA